MKRMIKASTGSRKIDDYENKLVSLFSDYGDVLFHECFYHTDKPSGCVIRMLEIQIVDTDSTHLGWLIEQLEYYCDDNNIEYYQEKSDTEGFYDRVFSFWLSEDSIQ